MKILSRICVAVFLVAAVFAPVSLVAQDDAEDVLKDIAKDKDDLDDVRSEALKTLRVMEVVDVALYGDLSLDGGDKRRVRLEAVRNLALCPADDATVKAALKTLATSTQEEACLRVEAIRAAGKLDIDTVGVRAELRQMAVSADENLRVRSIAIGVLCEDLDTGTIGDLVGVLVNGEQEVRIRISVLTGMRESDDAGYLGAVKELIATTQPESGLNGGLLGAENSVARIRIIAIGVAEKHLDDSAIVAAVKVLAADKTEGTCARDMAIRLLGNFQTETSSIETLTGIVDNATDSEDMRIAAMRAVSKSRAPESYALVVKYLKDKTAPEKLRHIAVALLANGIPGTRTGAFGEMVAESEAWSDVAGAVGKLEEVARDTTDEKSFRLRVIRCVCGSTNSHAQGMFRGLASDKGLDKDIRICAIRSILLDSEGYSALMARVNDAEEDEDVKAAALKALGDTVA